MKIKTYFLVFAFSIPFIKHITAQEVTINDNFVVESDGTMRFDSGAVVWDDLRVSPDATAKGNDAPVYETFRNGTTLWFFEDNNFQSVRFTVQIPHTWKEGTDLEPHIHWTAVENGATTSERVEWNLEYTVANFGSQFGVTDTLIATTMAGDGETTGILAYKHMITPFGTIDGSELKISSILIFKLFRNGGVNNDDFGGHAGYLSFDLHYQMDTHGSRLRYVK